MAIKGNKKAAMALKVLALGEIQINAARATMNAWASGTWQENVGETIAIGAQQTAATTKVARQSFEFGGVIQPEPGVNRRGDNTLFRGNPGEEVLTEDNPRHIKNAGMMGNTYNVTVTGNVGTNEQMLAQAVVNALDEIERTGRPVGV